MRFLKGDIKTAIENAKKKKNRIVVISISKHFPDISENKIPGNIIEHDGIHYMITQYVEGEPRHYDTEEIRIQTFKACLTKLKSIITDDIKEIAIQHLFGSHNIDQWKVRKELLKEFEKDTGCVILVYVPDVPQLDNSNDSDNLTVSKN